MGISDVKKPSNNEGKSENDLALAIDLTEKIRAEAQKIYETRQAKNLQGDESSDWLKAEAKINGQRKPIRPV